MSWFFKSGKPQGRQGSAMSFETGSHRSPGLAELCKEMRERSDVDVLDLGTSSTENVQFLSGFTSNVTVLGLFQSCVGQEGGQRSDVFRFDEEAAKALPKGNEQFDIVIAWDLLHYFDNAGFAEFNRGLSRLCRPEALVYLLAANHAPVSREPIHFRIEKEDSLFYTLPDGESSGSARLVTRDVEQRMTGFRPWRLFQLRNGMQEFMFRFEGTSDAEAASPNASTKAAANTQESKNRRGTEDVGRHKGSQSSSSQTTSDTSSAGRSSSGESSSSLEANPVPSRGRPPVQRGRRGKKGRR